MSLMVRRATEDDWSSLRRIRLTALAEAPWAFGSTLERERGFTEETWRLRARAHPVFLAVDGDQIVGTATGFVDAERDPEEVQLVAMYVAPGSRGHGCARLLLDAVVTEAADHGARRVLLHVTTANPGARHVYRTYGFEETGRRHPSAHSPDLHEVEMVLPLAPTGPGAQARNLCPQGADALLGDVGPRS